MEERVEIILNSLVLYGTKLIYALLILLIGALLIKLFVTIFEKAIKRTKLEESLHSFLKSIVSIVLKIVLFITAASTLGIKMTSFITLLGAAGLAIGLALQGSLSNFAGGVLLLMFKPFRVGDFVEAQGVSGVIKDIQILYTVIITVDNKQIFIPNGNLANNSIVNYSSQTKRRVDVNFGVGYESDIKKVKEIVKGLIAKNDKVLDNEANFVGVIKHGESSVDFVVRAWVKSADYWDVFFYFQEELKIAFDENGINIPYPQMDVFIKNKD